MITDENIYSLGTLSMSKDNLQCVAWDNVLRGYVYTNYAYNIGRDLSRIRYTSYSKNQTYAFKRRNFVWAANFEIHSTEVYLRFRCYLESPASTAIEP